ncbi:MarR family winged helix-turn-helix transcriptional regulator [Pseudonocardia bannensis]|uniref:MarR family winged helix-turn-helix transcriptional regulator n=1 Tax=Pseudonocardia bannensis TaxID=630973 RepID=UPI0028AE3640|nr:helix-turn-helix domain-containing protein [Pseudonocardia bannensis]
MVTTDDSTPEPTPGAPGPGPGSAFLLAQLGSYAAEGFGERIAELGLTPPQTGLRRAVAAQPGQSQQALAKLLGTPPNRLVTLVDGLDERGVLERRRNPDDRRAARAAPDRSRGEVAAPHRRCRRRQRRHGLRRPRRERAGRPCARDSIGSLPTTASPPSAPGLPPAPTPPASPLVVDVQSCAVGGARSTSASPPRRVSCRSRDRRRRR